MHFVRLSAPCGGQSALIAAGLALVLGAALPAAAQVKPNVIVMLADDMGIGDTSAYLGKKLEAGGAPIATTVKTPNMERLAQMGTIFTDVHTPSSMCSTTRYALLTGRYAPRSYVKMATTTSSWVSPNMIDDQRRTIADMMQDAGYSTQMLGKWHVGARFYADNGTVYVPPGENGTEAMFNAMRFPTAENPNVTSIENGPVQHGFDYFYGMMGNHQFNRGNIRGYFENNTFQGIPLWTNTSIGATGNGGIYEPNFDVKYVGQTLGNKALDRIDQYAAGATDGKPMFMYYALMANHGDPDPPPTITLQGQSTPVYDQARLTNGINPGLRWDMVLENDIVLGAMLDKLENTIDPQTGGPMIDNTLIIFTSDNGADNTLGPLTAGLKGQKKSIYEGGHRVPFFAAWPGKVPAAAVSDQLFGLNDLYATLAAITGQPLGLEEAEDSENVLPALFGASDAQFRRRSGMIVHDNTAGNNIPTGAALAIRFGNMKLIVSPELANPALYPAGTAGRANAVALFDLGVDPGEANNLINSPAHAGLIAQMRDTLLKNWNQGYTRSSLSSNYKTVFATDGGTDLINNLNGAVGYEFTVGAAPAVVTRLGMWDDATADVANQETDRFNPDGHTAGTPDGLATSHWVRLFDKLSGNQIAAVQITNANSTVENEFRYVTLPSTVLLTAGREYAVTMSTSANDGDLYHSPVPSSANLPVVTTLLKDFTPLRTTTDGLYPTLLPDGTTATGAVSESIYAYRFYIGPTLGFSATSLGGNPDFNGDGLVDGRDLLVWQRGLGKENALATDGDADLNGVVDALDLKIWEEAVALAAGGGGFAAVPEPGTCTLVGVSTLAMTSVVRRRLAGPCHCQPACRPTLRQRLRKNCVIPARIRRAD